MTARKRLRIKAAEPKTKKAFVNRRNGPAYRQWLKQIIAEIWDVMCDEEISISEVSRRSGVPRTTCWAFFNKSQHHVWTDTLFLLCEATGFQLRHVRADMERARKTDKKRAG